MLLINENYQRLKGSYLFSEMAKRISAHKGNVIKLGIGDVTRPLPDAVIKAMRAAIDDMATPEGFHGYGPEQGYAWLREAIAENDFAGLGISADEIFVSDGAKCDTGNIQELFSDNCRVAVLDPVYPVYVDTNVMAGRSGAFDEANNAYENIIYLPCMASNGFKPALPKNQVDIIYLCYPNNPTGTVLKKADLAGWVDYAKQNDALILFDAAYEAFIREDDIPHSIYEIDGAKEVAIEFRSFSKTAGFTGARCAYTVVPKALFGKNSKGEKQSIHAMWNRRHTTKFNGVPYVTQKGAFACYSQEGKVQIKEIIDYYLGNARVILDGLSALGIACFGGVNSPYVWLQTPGGMPSWDFFDKLLKEAGVAGTPGAGFGSAGEGYFRLTGFNTRENTLKAMERFAALKL
ncbi:MAG: LL-diaminopimelate aminotransferase [Christensenellales bacterium]|jgi:LL-diaminopimelate aminotransferase